MWLKRDYVVFSLTYGVSNTGLVNAETFMKSEGPFLVIQVARERIAERTIAEALVLASSGRFGWIEHAWLMNEPKRARRPKRKRLVKVTTWK